jgi:hypothetical protein
LSMLIDINWFHSDNSTAIGAIGQTFSS